MEDERNELGELEPTTDENYRDGWDSLAPGDDGYVSGEDDLRGNGRPRGLPDRPRGVTLSDER
jgi:hypothetical protein